jgi:hypothetical protein
MMAYINLEAILTPLGLRRRESGLGDRKILCGIGFVFICLPVLSNFPAGEALRMTEVLGNSAICP